jgi:acetoin utilization deacetylase AcuC-like enzyme
MKGRVAVVDIDFHHGNGTQELFYADGRVLTVSIHGDPSDYFPYFTGFPHESGRGLGEGYNTNIVLEKGTRIGPYLDALQNQVVPLVKRFEPAYLIVAAGFDTYYKDPIGDFGLRTKDFAELGNVLAALELPTVIVQEGGYDAEHLGGNVVSMLMGFLGESPDA